MAIAVEAVRYSLLRGGFSPAMHSGPHDGCQFEFGINPPLLPKIP